MQTEPVADRAGFVFRRHEDLQRVARHAFERQASEHTPFLLSGPIGLGRLVLLGEKPFLRGQRLKALTKVERSIQDRYEANTHPSIIRTSASRSF